MNKLKRINKILNTHNMRKRIILLNKLEKESMEKPKIVKLSWNDIYIIEEALAMYSHLENCEQRYSRKYIDSIEETLRKVNNVVSSNTSLIWELKRPRYHATK